MITAINIKAILFGVITYGLLYIALFVATNLTGDLLQGYWGQFAISPYMTMMYPIAGYVSGLKAQSKGLLHGSLVGVCIAILTAIIAYSFIGLAWFGESIIGGTLNYLFTCVIICGLSGGVGELYSIKRFTA